MPIRTPKIQFVMLLAAGLCCVLAEARPKVYWTDLTGKIRRCNLDGSDVEDLVTSGVASPAGVALDLSAGRMYWTDSWARKIQRAKLDGTHVEDVIHLQGVYGTSLLNDSENWQDRNGISVNKC